MSIIVMNLLVGVAIDNVNGVADNAFIRRLCTQLKVSLDWEFASITLARRWAIKEECIKPNKEGNPIMAFIRGSGIVKRIARTVVEQETKVCILMKILNGGLINHMSNQFISSLQKLCTVKKICKRISTILNIFQSNVETMIEKYNEKLSNEIERVKKREETIYKQNKDLSSQNKELSKKLDFVIKSMTKGNDQVRGRHSRQK